MGRYGQEYAYALQSAGFNNKGIGKVNIHWKLIRNPLHPKLTGTDYTPNS